METNKSKYRNVNTTLGKQPSIGPFPADQLIPWIIICGVSYYLAHGIFRLNWVWTIAIAGWGISSWWIVTANGAWRILSKFVAVPRWTRGYQKYKTVCSLHSKETERLGAGEIPHLNE